MSAAPTPPSARQPLVVSWVAQMIGTMVLAGAVLYFVRNHGMPFVTEDTDWKRFAMLGILVGIAPALLYLRTFKPLLDADKEIDLALDAVSYRRLLATSLETLDLAVCPLLVVVILAGDAGFLKLLRLVRLEGAEPLDLALELARLHLLGPGGGRPPKGAGRHGR